MKKLLGMAVLIIVNTSTTKLYGGSYTNNFDALNLLQTIPNNYKLGKFELPNHNLYVDLKKLLLKAYQQGRTEATLERQEVVDLNAIRVQKIGFASTQAGNILQFFYGINSDFYPALPNTGAPRSNFFQEPIDSLENIAIVEPKLWGYPNPAINWLDIQYNLNQDVLSGENKLVITSTAGQTIQIIDLKNNTGVVQLNTTDWAGGIYFATLFSNKTRGTVYKFVVRK